MGTVPETCPGCLIRSHPPENSVHLRRLPYMSIWAPPNGNTPFHSRQRRLTPLYTQAVRVSPRAKKPLKYSMRKTKQNQNHPPFENESSHLWIFLFLFLFSDRSPFVGFTLCDRSSYLFGLLAFCLSMGMRRDP